MTKSGQYGLNNFKRDIGPSSKDLGPLRRLKHRMETCRLCYLIWKVILRDNCDKEPPLSHNGRDVECYLMFRGYMELFDPAENSAQASERLENYQGTESEKYDIMRLGIKIGVTPLSEADNMENNFHEIHFCFQACNIGAASAEEVPPFSGDPPRDMMILGGRRRPLVINLQWLRHWIQICEVEHGGACRPAQSKGQQE